MADPVRVLIADDHTIFRSGLHLLLSSEPDLQVVGEAIDGHAAVEMAQQLGPDIILMDIGMPGLSGIEATRRIKASLPDTAILVLTMHRSDEYFFEMLEAGASGYILKGAATGDLISAVRTVARGEIYLYPSMARSLVQEYLTRSGIPAPDLPQLTRREREVLQLIADGYSNQEIAERLVISPSTVHSHRTNLMDKLQLSSRRELVAYARRRGLLPDS